jgi:hypothetical protein
VTGALLSVEGKSAKSGIGIGPKSLCFTAANKKSTKENTPLKRGLNDMTMLIALLCNWSLVDEIRERADGAGFEEIG